MNGTAPTWSTLRELVSVVLAPQHLKRTVSVALIVGTAFFAMNQLGVILDGHATPVVWLKAALSYLTPLVVSTVGVLSATRRTAAHADEATDRWNSKDTEMDETTAMLSSDDVPGQIFRDGVAV